MRRRVVCPRSHPASPHLRRYFVGSAVARGISLGAPGALRATGLRRPGAWPPGLTPGLLAALPRLHCPCRPPIPTCRALSPLGHGLPCPPDEACGRESTSSLAVPRFPAAAGQLALQSTTGARRHRGHFRTAKPACSAGQNSRTCFKTRSEINYFLVITESGYSSLAITESGYSGLLNVTMATAIMASPMTATIPRHTPIGTVQPPQVRPGTRACIADGGRFRWVNTACLMGYTT